jgi:hypothetical protein
MTDIPRIVYDRLRIPPPNDAALAASHPDLELLAAFMDQALTPPGRENILRHLSLCEDCREIVVLATPSDEIFNAELTVQEQPAEAPVRVREREESQPVPIPLATKRDRWFGWARPNLGWAALAAGIAVAASMLVLHPLQQKQAMQPTPNQAVAANLPSAPDSQPATQPQQSSEASNKQSSSQNGSSPKPKKEAKSSFSMRQTHNTGAAPIVADNQSPRDEALMARGPASPIEKAKPALQDSESQAASAGATRAVKWQISEGVLERSFDNGQSWQIGLRANHPLLCYASHGQDIWVGGHAGTLLHSSDDGHTWAQVRTSQVPTSDGDSPSADVTGIDLRNADVASGSRVLTEILISTAAGEVWSSTDGGNTWSKQ